MGVLPTIRGLMVHDLIERQVLGGGPWLNPLWNRESSSFGGGGGSGGATEAFAARAAIYSPFTVSGDDDEFDDESFSGWTAVENGAGPTLTKTEGNDVLSILHPGNDGSAIHGFVKARTVSANDYVEVWASVVSANAAAYMVGCLFSDGTTWGTGNPVTFWINAQTTNNVSLTQFTNWQTVGTQSNFTFINAGHTVRGVGLRLVYEGSNNWRGYLSLDRISWIDVTGTLARTLTPTHVGFMCSSWITTAKGAFSIRYCRFGS
jgi:hypothetical protein